MAAYICETLTGTHWMFFVQMLDTVVCENPSVIFLKYSNQHEVRQLAGQSHRDHVSLILIFDVNYNGSP